MGDLLPRCSNCQRKGLSDRSVNTSRMLCGHCRNLRCDRCRNIVDRSGNLNTKMLIGNYPILLCCKCAAESSARTGCGRRLLLFTEATGE